jgi:hypothetical protein
MVNAVLKREMYSFINIESSVNPGSSEKNIGSKMY